MLYIFGYSLNYIFTDPNLKEIGLFCYTLLLSSWQFSKKTINLEGHIALMLFTTD